MRMRPLALIVLLAAALTPGLWWRSGEDWPRDNGKRSLTVERLRAQAPSYWPHQLRLVGVWRLSSDYNMFGGYSALVAAGDGTLTATSDIGLSLRMRRPDLPGPAAALFGEVPALPELHFANDIEAATSDPATGRRWLAYEGLNTIQRLEPGMRPEQAAVRPREMRDWPLNGGPEAMVRLADGRFIVLSEDPPWLSSGARPGLLFPFDPVAGAKALEFTFRPPIGFHPSDMAGLPDGRVVILLRAVDPPFPPLFRGMLVVADPAQIAAGKEWPWHKLADLASPLPVDNYEGLAILPETDGVALWLVSDDNLAHFQRTLLVKLHWRVPPRVAAQ
jgi:phytase-like protein